MIEAESIYTGSRSSPTPSALMIHEIDPTVKIWPGCGRDEEPMKKAILFDKETAQTPLPGAPTIDRISSAVLRGVSHEGRLIGRGVRDQELDGNRDTRNKIYTGSGHQCDVILYVLCSIDLYCWNTR